MQDEEGPKKQFLSWQPFSNRPLENWEKFDFVALCQCGRATHAPNSCQIRFEYESYRKQMLMPSGLTSFDEGVAGRHLLLYCGCSRNPCDVESTVRVGQQDNHCWFEETSSTAIVWRPSCRSPTRPNSVMVMSDSVNDRSAEGAILALLISCWQKSLLNCLYVTVSNRNL